MQCMRDVQPHHQTLPDGGNALQGTGTRTEMKIEERSKLANEGLVVAAVEVSF